jgi:hypothetical protein
MALAAPSLYLVSSLVDIEQAVESEWHILETPDKGEEMFGIGFTGMIVSRFNFKLLTSLTFSLM